MKVFELLSFFIAVYIKVATKSALHKCNNFRRLLFNTPVQGYTLYEFIIECESPPKKVI